MIKRAKISSLANLKGKCLKRNLIFKCEVEKTLEEIENLNEYHIYRAIALTHLGNSKFVPFESSPSYVLEDIGIKFNKFSLKDVEKCIIREFLVSLTEYKPQKGDNFYHLEISKMN